MVFLDFFPPLPRTDDGVFDIMRYSSEGNESNERPVLSEQERHEDFQRHKEELKKKPRRKKRASSSMQSSTFQGELGEEDEWIRRRIRRDFTWS